MAMLFVDYVKDVPVEEVRQKLFSSEYEESEIYLPRIWGANGKWEPNWKQVVMITPVYEQTSVETALAGSRTTAALKRGSRRGTAQREITGYRLLINDLEADEDATRFYYVTVGADAKLTVTF